MHVEYIRRIVCCYLNKGGGASIVVISGGIINSNYSFLRNIICYRNLGVRSAPWVDTTWRIHMTPLNPRHATINQC